MPRVPSTSAIAPCGAESAAPSTPTTPRLPRQLDDRARHGPGLGSRQDFDLRVQDPRLLLTRLERDLLANLPNLLQALLDRLQEALLLQGDGLEVQVPVLDLDLLGIHDVDGTDADARRRGDARELRHSSPNLLLTTRTRASRASVSSLPSAFRVTFAPISAASIMTPRMLLPFTSRPSRITKMCAANFAASSINTEQARARSPRRFRIVAVSCTIPHPFPLHPR